MSSLYHGMQVIISDTVIDGVIIGMIMSLDTVTGLLISSVTWQPLLRNIVDDRTAIVVVTNY